MLCPEPPLPVPSPGVTPGLGSGARADPADPLRAQAWPWDLLPVLEGASWECSVPPPCSGWCHQQKVEGALTCSLLSCSRVLKVPLAPLVLLVLVVLL